MKRYLSLFLALVLLFTFVPFSAIAAEAEHSEYNNLVNKAAAVFPEYAEKLLHTRAQASMYTDNAATRELVVKETRSVSDTESITYVEYSDGLILLSESDFIYETTVVDSSTGSTYRNITLDIEAAYVGDGYDGYFYLDGVSYTLRNGYDNFDSITDPGTARKGDNCILAERTDYTADESYTGYARIAYSLSFRFGSAPTQFYTSRLTIHVGEDTAVVEHFQW